MKVIAIAPATVTLELDCTDCLALADACGAVVRHDCPGDWSLIDALGAALTASAVAAFAVEHGNGEESAGYTMEELRRLRGPFDTHAPVPRRIVSPFAD